MNASTETRYQEFVENTIGVGMHSLFRCFSDRAFETAFQRYRLPGVQKQLRLTLSFCATFYLLFALTDVAALGYTERALYSLIARVLVAMSAATGILALARHPQSLRVPVIVATLVEIVGMAAFMVVVLCRPAEVHWHAMSMGIMLIVVYLFIPNAFINATCVALASTLVFSLIALQVGGLSVSDVFTMAMLLILVNATGIVAACRHEQLRRQEFGAQTELRRISVLDPLTGCYNRRHLQDHLLDREVERAYRYPAWLTVIMCDLDHFKRVNDTYGHVVGDAVLQCFSALLQTMCRERVDSVIRYGGEEFLLLLPETNLAGGIGLAERLRAMLADQPIHVDAAQSVAVTASFGVAAVDFSVEGHGVSPQKLVAMADKLLYRAKRAGRNRVESTELTHEPLVLWPTGRTKPDAGLVPDVAKT